MTAYTMVGHNDQQLCSCRWLLQRQNINNGKSALGRIPIWSRPVSSRPGRSSTRPPWPELLRVSLITLSYSQIVELWSISFCRDSYDASCFMIQQWIDLESTKSVKAYYGITLSKSELQNEKVLYSDNGMIKLSCLSQINYIINRDKSFIG